jgi:hypothetical protein
MIKTALLLLLASLAACSTTERLVYIEPQPYVFQKVTQQPPRSIRVADDDAETYKAYIDKFREQIDFFNQQVEDYFNSFKN